MSLEWNKEFLDAYDLIENTNTNVFIAGRAGTGKSTFLNYFKKNTLKGGVAYLAPTGIAAINIDGTTIHRFFGFPSDITLSKVTYKSDLEKRLNKIQTIVIDEISMVRSDMVEMIDFSLRLHTRNHLPFGGKQMLFVGDLFQLPPVTRQIEEEIFLKSGLFFFNSEAVMNANFRMVEFNKIYRQTDISFINLLNRIRDGSVTDEDISLLNQRYRPYFKNDDWIVMSSLKSIVNSINTERLNSLRSQLFVSIADVDGNFPENFFPAEHTLALKLGAHVMTLLNHPAGYYQNGTLATVIEMNDEHIRLMKKDGFTFYIEKNTWKISEYYIEKDKLESRVIGKYTQFPLALAWATTIHKAQGKTMSNVILDVPKIFAPGMIYVALSRVRSLNDLILRQPMKKSDIYCDESVLRFFAMNKKDWWNNILDKPTDQLS